MSGSTSCEAESWNDRAWDVVRPFLTYIGFLIGTSMVLAGSIFTALPSLLSDSGERKRTSSINEAAVNFFGDVLAWLAITIGVAGHYHWRGSRGRVVIVYPSNQYSFAFSEGVGNLWYSYPERRDFNLCLSLVDTDRIWRDDGNSRCPRIWSMNIIGILQRLASLHSLDIKIRN